MCLAVPGRIVRVEDLGESRLGHVQFGVITQQAYLDFVPEASIGDYVLVHMGFAISKVDADEAQRIFELLDEIR